MRIFVTGATGLIGTAVVRELQKAGHHVLGLARSDQAAATLAQAGVEPHRGELADPASLVAGVRAAHGVIHLGFVMDFSDIEGIFRTDREAIRAMGSALADRPFVGTSGTMVLAPGKVGTEDDAADPRSTAQFRVAAEDLALSFGARIVRPAPSVHGDADHHGFVPLLISTARKSGFSAYVEEGANRWPAVHLFDCARLFARVLERGAVGQRYHAVGDEGIPTRAIAEAIGRRLGVPTRSIPREKASEHFGPFVGAIFAADNPTSNALTRARLDWQPTEPGLLADLEGAHYFANP